MTQHNQTTSGKLGKAQKIKLENIYEQPDDFALLRTERNDEQVRQLIAALERRGDLDPITVWVDPDTGNRHVINGSHRIWAYKTKRRKLIAARVFHGTRKQARLHALSVDAKPRLVATQEDRLNAAWKLVSLFWQADSGYEYSVKETAGAANVCGSTVDNMRKVFKRLRQREEVIPQTWGAALAREYYTGEDGQLTDDQRDEMTKAEVAKLHAEIGQFLTKKAHTAPEAVGRFLAQALGPNAWSIKRFMSDEASSLEIIDDGPDDAPF
ncbi:ParB N-terminal domain-containing protein [Roseovarius nanhaiticus]|uniref:ParB N-terminal domain-containing protein n=1 Tax=Roseovarius nanhaiticus TaxID=573024 RepID=UPI002490C5EE|nr:ParB N-terminal domain-containing protein [Roseovarius nanhaiticus]